MRILRIAILSFLLFCGPLFAQVTISITNGEKNVYQPDDKIEILVLANSLPETCQSGMDRTKVFVSGLEIQTQSEWKLVKKGLWQKSLVLTVVNTKSSEAKLTVLRRVDKEKLFKQHFFKVQGHL